MTTGTKMVLVAVIALLVGGAVGYLVPSLTGQEGGTALTRFQQAEKLNRNIAQPSYEDQVETCLGLWGGNDVGLKDCIDAIE